MKPIDVKNYFKSTYNFAKKTGITHSTLIRWIKLGYIPSDAQIRIERITNGELKVDFDHIK